jgi:hypothetical protein
MCPNCGENTPNCGGKYLKVAQILEKIPEFHENCPINTNFKEIPNFG